MFPPAPTRVLLADDHEVVRAGLRNALLSLPSLSVVGELADGADLLATVADLHPDLLVVDVSMPFFDPVADITALRQQHPTLKVLVVSAFADEGYVVGLLGAGVNGYHLKDQPLADLQLAVQRVLAGDRWISGPLVDKLVHHRAPAPASPATPPTPSAHSGPALTRRQRELLRLLTQGFDNRKIAQAMDLSIKTVENHLTSLYRALNVDSRLEATNYAVHHPEVLAALGADAVKVEPKVAGKLTVLLVDDNARYRQQLARLIGKNYPHATLYEAEDMAEAVRLAEHVHPRLALVDVVLQDEDGIQCTRRIKLVAPETRVVLISAYPDREFRRLGMNAGAIALLDKKDLDTATVRQVVDDALGGG